VDEFGKGKSCLRTVGVEGADPGRKAVFIDSL